MLDNMRLGCWEDVMLEGWDAGILAGLKVGRIRGFEDKKLGR